MAPDTRIGVLDEPTFSGKQHPKFLDKLETLLVTLPSH
jgi:hypothetical protein